MTVRTPLRYPGGKHRALERIFKQFPAGFPTPFSGFREPFVGGGSVFIAVRQRFPDVPVWINDLNPDVAAFWRTAQNDLPALVDAVRTVRDHASDGKRVYLHWRDLQPASDFERAVRFFVLNRITFSGTTDSGGYSAAAFATRFTHSSITRLEGLANVLRGVRITNLDYTELLRAGEDGADHGALVFLDPPYWSATQSRLYGTNGHLHTGFDHDRFAAALRDCSLSWLVTYDDSPRVRELFAFAQLEAWTLQYGMNNFRQVNAAAGAELFVRNY